MNRDAVFRNPRTRPLFDAAVVFERLRESRSTEGKGQGVDRQRTYSARIVVFVELIVNVRDKAIEGRPQVRR